MDLSTTYMGMKLAHPIMASASPLTGELDTIKQLEDAGASALVIHSLFEEQITHDREAIHHHTTEAAESHAEALSYFPEMEDYRLGPDAYLEHVSAAKKSVNIPVIASLNGSTVGGWVDYAKKIEQAGADALELNVYLVPTDPNITGADVENTHVEILKAVKAAVKIPAALKVGPYFSSIAAMAKRFDDAGADALVLFNRFYQPDIDIENLEVTPNLMLSTPYEMRLPLRWVAILHGHLKANLAATTGIHTATDVIKMIMAGADVTQLCSVLLQRGTEELTRIYRGVATWMEEHEYDSIAKMKGSMSQKSCPDPTAFERGNYMKTLQSYA